MGKIGDYPDDDNITGDERVIGSNIGPSKETRQFTLANIADYTTEKNSLVGEAPKDGKKYARRNGNWAEVVDGEPQGLLPAGGTAGQIIKKIDGADYNTEWGDNLSGAEIKSLYEAEADTNAFTDAEKSKLTGVENGATADQTGAEIETSLDTQLGNTRWKAVEVPAGGTADQVLSKVDGTDYNLQWSTVSGGSGSLTGWEVAALVEGSGQYAANATELIRAQATGKPVYIPPGVYELDNCLITITESNRDFIIWANEVTIKRANDPLLGVRDTEQMLRIEGATTLRDFIWHGNTIFDGNDGLAYQSGITPIFFVNAGSARPSDPGDCFIDNWEFRNVAVRSFWMDGATANPRFNHARINKVHLRDAAIYSWRFRVRIRDGEVIVGDLSCEETGGDKGLRWGNFGYGSGLGSFSFELGETSQPNTHTQFLKINSFIARYPKYGIVGWAGVQNVEIGTIHIYNAYRNEDGTDATMPESTRIMKIGSDLWSVDSANTYSIDIGRLIVRNSNTGKALPDGVGGFGTQTYALEIDDSSPMFTIGWAEIDGGVQLGRRSENDGQQMSEPIRIGTMIWRGASNANEEFEFENNVVIDNFICDGKNELDGQNRLFTIYINDEVTINSFRRIDCSPIWWMAASSASANSDLPFDWQHGSDIKINNGDLGSIYMFIGTTYNQNNYLYNSWNPNPDGSTSNGSYIKARFNNCKFSLRNYITQGWDDSNFIGDGVTTDFDLSPYLNSWLSTRSMSNVEIDGVTQTNGVDYTYSTVTNIISFTSPPGNGAVIRTQIFGTITNTFEQYRNRIQLEFINSKIKEFGNGEKEFWLDPTTGLRTTTTTGLPNPPGTIDITDGTTIIKDLPTGVSIGRSLFINTTYADSNQYIDDGEVVYGYGEVEGSGLNNVVEDTTPQLGGDLDLNSNNIDGLGKVLISDGTAAKTAALITEVNGELVQFGTNYEQSGASDLTNTGGYFRIDSRTSKVATELFTVHYQPTGTVASNSIVFQVGSTGDVVAAGEITTDKVVYSALNTAPASATDTGTTGEIRITSTHIYVCIATNTWVRSALTTW